METQDSPTAKGYLKTINILYFGILFACILFGFVLFFIKEDSFLSLNITDDVFIIIALVIAIGGVVFSRIMNKQGVEKLRMEEDLTTKLKMHTAQSLISYSLIEAPIIFAFIMYFLKGNRLFLIIGGLLIIYFLTLRPNKSAVLGKLNLTFDEENDFLSEN